MVQCELSCGSLPRAYNLARDSPRTLICCRRQELSEEARKALAKALLKVFPYGMQLLTSAAAYTLGITATQVSCARNHRGAQPPGSPGISACMLVMHHGPLTSMLCGGRCWVSVYASPAAPPCSAPLSAYWVWASRQH